MHPEKVDASVCAGLCRRHPDGLRNLPAQRASVARRESGIQLLLLAGKFFLFDKCLRFRVACYGEFRLNCKCDAMKSNRIGWRSHLR